MFKWLFGRKEAPKTEASTAPAPSPAPVAVAPVQTAPAAPSAPEVVQAAAAPAPSTVSTPSGASRSTPKAVLLKQSLSLLAQSDDVEPKVGLDAVAVAPPLVEAGKVVKVQAGGRRVVASVGDSAKMRVYSRRADGTYRLEGAPAQSASRLIVRASA